jgi:N-methylhydantoinase A
MSAGRIRLGVDIGGTFTDIVLDEADGVPRRWKVPSTPPEFDRGVLDGIAVVARDLGESPASLLGRLDELVHGTTVTTNIVLTRTGERVGMLTTAGFGDLYEQARQYRNGEQDPSKVGHPRPLVPRDDIEEVRERIDYQGRVVVPVDVDGLRASVRRLAADGIRSFAVCFLWAFRNPAHEQVAKTVIDEEVPGAYVAASFEACPVLGEYERMSTTAITAFAGPALGDYANRLEQRLRDEGFAGTLLLMKSDGGLGSVESAVRTAGQTVYSGPVAGIMGAKALGEATGDNDLITFDMGGTSTDVGLVHGGEVRTTNLQFLDQQALATPMVDVTTVGAGGGSIAWSGPGGVLRVGPQSAGAVPGAACYGRGGELPTVTDANVVLGLIDPDYFLGGKMRLDALAASRAIDALAYELGMAPLETAGGIFRVVNSVMADAIRLRTVFAGLDPRSFDLVSFGGAGGLHAASVASELGIGRVVVPALASVYSAAGLITTDIVYSAGSATHKTLRPDTGLARDDLADLNAAFAQLDEEVRGAFAAHDLPAEALTITHAVDLCYLRQILDFEIAVPSRALGAEDVAAAVRAFDERYAAIYGEGAAAPDAGYDLKAFKVTGVGRITLSAPSGNGAAYVPYTAQPASTRMALAHADAGGLEEVAVHVGAELRRGATLSGPAIVDYDDTTVLVPVGWTATVDPRSNLVLEAV